MTRKFHMTTDRVYAENGGAVFFDTAAYPVQFYPSGDEVVLVDQVISFPDLVKGNAYSYARGQISGTDYEGCASYVTLAPQNWGPIAAGEMAPDYELADTVIGTVPGDTDIILVYVNLTRTGVPDQVNGKTPPVMFKEGQWVYAPGGSLPAEYLPPLARKFAVLLADELNLDGTKNLILRRKQGVQRRLYTFWEPGNATNTSGWTYGGSAGPYGHIAQHIQSKGPRVGFGFYNRDGSNPCSLTDTSNYGSTFTGSIRVVPGRSGAAPSSTATGAALVFLGLVGLSSSVSSSLNLSSIGIGAPPKSGQTRHVIIAVSASSRADSSGPKNINSATLTPAGGSPIAMTRIAHLARWLDLTGTNDYNNSVAFFIAAVPDDAASADVSIGYSASMRAHIVNCWAAYDLVSATPVAVLATADHNIDKSLATAAGGFTIAQSIDNQNALNSTITGLESYAEDVVQHGGYTTLNYVGRAFQNTDGSTLTLRHDSPGLASGTFYWPMVAVSLH